MAVMQVRGAQRCLSGSAMGFARWSVWFSIASPTLATWERWRGIASKISRAWWLLQLGRRAPL